MKFKMIVICLIAFLLGGCESQIETSETAVYEIEPLKVSFIGKEGIALEPLKVYSLQYRLDEETVHLYLDYESEEKADISIFNPPKGDKLMEFFNENEVVIQRADLKECERLSMVFQFYSYYESEDYEIDAMRFLILIPKEYVDIFKLNESEE